MADGSRGQRFCQLPGVSEARARETAAYLTERAIADGLTQAKPEPVRPAPPPCPPEATVRAWSDRWCDDRERRGLTTVKDDRGRLRKWILPVLGALPAATLGQSDLEGFIEHLDERVREGELSWKTARNVWGLLTKACDDMVRAKSSALRVRKDNPATLVRGPDEGVVKSKAYLYPQDFAAVMACERVPIRWRRLIALAVYTYTRAGETEALGLEDVDFVTMRIHVHRSIDHKRGVQKETKTNNPRHVPIEPAVLPLVEVMTREAVCAPRLLTMPPLCDLSARLRQYLAWAGVTRGELFANDATRKQITWHDLRATGITWMAVRGDEPMRIMRRAGHENIATTMGYVREAESLEYLRGAVFPPLPEAILLPGLLPEGPAAWGKLRKIASPAGFENSTAKIFSTNPGKFASCVLPKRVETDPSQVDKCAKCRRRAELGQNAGHPFGDPDHDAIAALVGGFLTHHLAASPFAALELAEAHGDPFADDDGAVPLTSRHATGDHRR